MAQQLNQDNAVNLSTQIHGVAYALVPEAVRLGARCPGNFR
jgi:hypothetical protein